MVVKALMIAGLLALPLPGLLLGARGVRGRRRITHGSPDRVPLVLLVVVRVLVLLLVLALTAVTLLSLVGALVEGVEVMPGLVYVFFFLDLLVAALVVLTFGRLDRRRARRPANPAVR